MRALAIDPAHDLRTRPACASDLDALVDLEALVFAADRISRRGFRRFLASANAGLLVAEHAGRLAGYALVLFRRDSMTARLYSIAVAPDLAGQGVGGRLLAAAEAAAVERRCPRMRLEVHVANAAAIARYRRSGYREFGRYAAYYGDGGDALRLEKRLGPPLSGLRTAPPYFHQTTEFTCGAACMMMALAWADPRFRPAPGLELKLWREATTIFMTSGPGGCEPYGIAVTLHRHGLRPEVFVNRPGPYFLDTVRSADKRRVMRMAQEEFRREAEAAGIPIHLARSGESGLMEAFDHGHAAIVLVAGYRRLRRNVPHWVFTFGHEAGHVLVHDPAAQRDLDGNADAPETHAIPWTEFEGMTRFGDLRAAVLIRRGPNP
jgi:ribosomal protein S18 acetylase RimI-like enzyme